LKLLATDGHGAESSRHPTAAELILRAVSPLAGQTMAAVVRHLDGCADCTARMMECQRRVAALDSTGKGSDHLDELLVASLVDARSLDLAMIPAVRHLAGCGQCRAALGELLALQGDAAVRAELARLDSANKTEHRAGVVATRRRMAIVALATAAALLIVVNLSRGPAPTSEGADVLRHATITTAAASQLLAPVIGGGRDVSLLWTRVPRSDLYRVSIFDQTGHVVWEREVSDTIVTLPISAWTNWAGRLRWRVAARTGFDQWVESDFSELNLKGIKR
jgi:hypothetical protein